MTQELPPGALALASLLKAGALEESGWALEHLKREAPQLALTHFIDAQLAYAAQDWPRLASSARLCWCLGGRDAWVALVLGGLAMSVGLNELTAHLEASAGVSSAPLAELSPQEQSATRRALTAPLSAPSAPPSAPTSSPISPPISPPVSPAPSLSTVKRAPLTSPPPEWLERSGARERVTPLSQKTLADWLERSQRRAPTALNHALLPSWLEGRQPERGLSVEQAVDAQTPLEEGISVALSLELPQAPLQALKLSEPLLSQPGREPRTLQGTFLLITYPQALSLLDLARPQAPWYFKREEISALTSTLTPSEWRLAVRFHDGREVSFKRSAGVRGGLEEYAEAGEALSAWLTPS